jgi:hypothetical protein
MTWVVAVMYERRALSCSDKAITVGLEMSALSSSSAFYVLSGQQKESDFFNSLYRGGPSSPSHYMKWLRVARYPMSC